MWLTSRARKSVCLLLCLSSPLGCTSHVLDPDTRKPEVTRDLLVTVPQDELDANFTPSMTGLAIGGFIGGMVDLSINQARAADTLNKVQVIRDAMQDYDFDQRALTTTQQALESLGWMSIGSSRFDKQVDNAKLASLLNASQAKELVVVSFRYWLHDNFSSMWTTWNISLVPTRAKDHQKPIDRLKSSNFAYGQDFSCVSSLANPDRDAAINAAAWAQDQSKWVRATIESCLAEMGPLLKLSIEMTPQQRADTIKRSYKKSSTFTDIHVSGMPLQESSVGSLVMEPTTKRWVLVLKTKAGE